MKIDIETDKSFIIKTPIGQVSDVGVCEITVLLGKLELPDLPEEFDYQWLTNRGTLPKRITSYYHKNHAIKLTSEAIGCIGNIGKAHSSDGQTYILDFTQSFDWCDGDYGDSGSCFWGDRSGALTMLKQHHAYAVRGYRANGRGYARAWLVRLNDSLLIAFNGYGETALTFARLLALHWSASYKRIKLSNRGSDGGVLYINNGTGYAIGNSEQTNAIESHDFGWKEICEDMVTCWDCESEVDEGDRVRAIVEEFGFGRRQTLCSSCYFTCENCEVNYSNRLRRGEDCEGYCPSCWPQIERAREREESEVTI